MLIGNVGKDPEVRYVDQGQPVAFGVADRDGPAQVLSFQRDVDELSRRRDRSGVAPQIHAADRLGQRLVSLNFKYRLFHISSF